MLKVFLATVLALAALTACSKNETASAPDVGTDTAATDAFSDTEVDAPDAVTPVDDVTATAG